MRLSITTASLLGGAVVLALLPALTSALEIRSVHGVRDIRSSLRPIQPVPNINTNVAAPFAAMIERACAHTGEENLGPIPRVLPGFCPEEIDPPPPPPQEEGEVVISEIMYSPDGADSGHEWIEVWNGTNQSIDLSDWEFADNSGDHGLALAVGVITIDAGARFIIADDAVQFLVDYPEFSGILFDSSFSLSNDGETIAVKNAEGGVVDEVAYDPADGADGDGNSLQRSENGTWVGAPPTPGEES